MLSLHSKLKIYSILKKGILPLLMMMTTAVVLSCKDCKDPRNELIVGGWLIVNPDSIISDNDMCQIHYADSIVTVYSDDHSAISERSIRLIFDYGDKDMTMYLASNAEFTWQIKDSQLVCKPSKCDIDIVDVQFSPAKRLNADEMKVVEAEARKYVQTDYIDLLKRSGMNEMRFTIKCLDEKEFVVDDGFGVVYNAARYDSPKLAVKK